MFFTLIITWFRKGCSWMLKAPSLWIQSSLPGPSCQKLIWKLDIVWEYSHFAMFGTNFASFLYPWEDILLGKRQLNNWIFYHYSSNTVAFFVPDGNDSKTGKVFPSCLHSARIPVYGKAFSGSGASILINCSITGLFLRSGLAKS